MRIFGFEVTRAKAAAPVPIGTGRWFDVVRESFPGAWQRNVEVESRDALLTFSAVYGAVSMIAADIAKLRIKLTERIGVPGVWSEVVLSPYATVLRKPNRFMTRVQFVENWLLCKLLYGNAYMLKERDQRGIVSALYVLDSRRVTPLVTEDGSVYYQIAADNLSGVQNQITVPASEVIHDRMATLFHPLVGVSPIRACGASATQGMRIQGNSAKFFENMSRPSGMLTAPGTIDEITASRLRREWEERFGGTNIGRLAVLGDGLKYEPMTIPASDAQLIEQLRWTVEDVARAFRIPLHRLGAGPAPSLSNLESLEAQYYGNCLQVLIEAMESCLDEGLGLPTNYATEFDLRGLLRMDTGSRFDALSKAVNGGWMAPNEARQLEDLPPVEGGDTPYLQVQNYSLAALARRDSSEPPPSSPPAERSGSPDPRMDALIEALQPEQRARYDQMRDKSLLGLETE